MNPRGDEGSGRRSQSPPDAGRRQGGGTGPPLQESSRRPKKTPVRRGDIFFANLNPVMGSEQGGVRPVLVLQNDRGNRHAPTTVVAPITSRPKRKQLPTHVELPPLPGLERSSLVLVEQLRTIDRWRLKRWAGHLDPDTMERVRRAIVGCLGLDGRETEGVR